MTLATIAEAGGLVLVLVGVITLYVQLRDRVRTRLDHEQEKRAKDIEAAEERGRRSRDDEVALLRSQRDDARRERDAALRRADEYERRYNDLIERRGNG